MSRRTCHVSRGTLSPPESCSAALGAAAAASVRRGSTSETRQCAAGGGAVHSADLRTPRRDGDCGVTVSRIMAMAALLLLLPLAQALLPDRPAYYIQTDEGPNRFFQFSSGPGAGRCSAPAF